MRNFFKFYENNFASISITIISLVIIILLSNSDTNTLAIMSLFVIVGLYILLFVKHLKLKISLNKNQLFESIDDKNIQVNMAYATIDQSFKIIDFNNHFLKECNYEKKNLLGKNLFDILSTESINVLKDIEEHGNFKGIIESCRDKQQNFHSLIIEPIKNQSKKEYIAKYNNLSNSLKTEQELKAQFLIDKTTGLATKSKLLDDLENIKNPKFGNNTLIYIHIDDFDEINEYFGMDAGNKILSHLASWLTNKLPTKNSTLYKLDLNSFAILITQRLNVVKLDDFLKKISHEIEKESFYFKKTELNLSFTLGASHCKTDMVKCTYLALKDAQNLKKSYKIYDKSCQHEERFVKNIKMSQNIKNAITENRVVPFFQPIYNLKTDKIEKFESLIRIQNKGSGYLKPIEFLDVAKKSKLYLSLSHSMIKSSFEKVESSNIPITINISIDDILDKRVSNFILRKLNNTNIGHLITFEILESEQIDNYVRVINFIKKIKILGCKVAIDDFGSGYSNFEQLLKLDVDYLKIDGSLIRNINTNKDNEIMTKSIVSFAKEMGIKTIAEFVSSKEIYDKVKLLGIDYAQGYHIGRPSPRLGK
jgi:diguanylate cyclase (GGDEF)-like protein